MEKLKRFRKKTPYYCLVEFDYSILCRLKSGKPVRCFECSLYSTSKCLCSHLLPFIPNFEDV